MNDIIDFKNMVINKPVEDKELFRQAMRFVCNSENKCKMLEYPDKYQIVEKENEEPINEEFIEDNYVSQEERLDDIENALLELASIIGE